MLSSPPTPQAERLLSPEPGLAWSPGRDMWWAMAPWCWCERSDGRWQDVGRGAIGEQPSSKQAPGAAPGRLAFSRGRGGRGAEGSPAW